MISGWCSPAFGTCESAKAHGVCEDRIRRGLIDQCDCPRGHDGNPVVERDSVGCVSAANGKMGVTNKAAPGGASTPLSQGLADWIGVD